MITKDYKILSVLAFIIMVFPLLTISCTSPTITPEPISEPEIPTNFTTYEHEGLFSISYPSDWQPATSLMEEMWGEQTEYVKSLDPNTLIGETEMVFLGGKLVGDVYLPYLDILVVPCEIGYRTVDEISEAENAWARENTPQYREFSVIKTAIEGREALICDYECYYPDEGMSRYLQLITCKDDFAWCVTCSAYPADFEYYRETFDSVVRSLRILKGD